MTNRWPGNFIGATVTPAGPYQDSAASAVWSLNEQVNWIAQDLWPTFGRLPPLTGDIALFAGGGNSGNASNIISYVTITSTGNSTDFGDLQSARAGQAACSSSTRGIFAGGYDSGFSSTFIINYVTIANRANSLTFGFLDSFGSLTNLGGASNSTRGILFGGSTNTNGTALNGIQYITIATTGDALDFGDLNTPSVFLTALASTTRALKAGGNNASGTRTNIIEYVTISTTGNATDFGDLSQITTVLAGCSSSTRGVFGGGNISTGSNRTNVISYVTIASAGNTTDFGDLANETDRIYGTSNATRGLFAGGDTSSGTINVIQYITIASASNTTDFGDLLNTASALSACSNSHGGL